MISNIEHTGITHKVRCSGITYELGVDDEPLKKLGNHNLSALESEPHDNDGIQHYACLREMSERGRESAKVIVQNIILAHGMLEAIRLFESDAGKRLWIVEDGSKATQQQTGVGRAGSKDFMLVRIIHVPKQGILAA